MGADAARSAAQQGTEGASLTATWHLYNEAAAAVASKEEVLSLDAVVTRWPRVPFCVTPRGAHLEAFRGHTICVSMIG